MLDHTFSTDVLREWVIRAHDWYGHLQTGHKDYLESCARLGTTPYTADFVNYDERNYSHTNKDTTYLMTMSDWFRLYHRDFTCLIAQHSPHTITVGNGHTCIIGNNSVVCAGLSYMVPSMELFISENIDIDIYELNRSSMFAQKCCRYWLAHFSATDELSIFIAICMPPKYTRKIGYRKAEPGMTWWGEV